MPTLPLPRRGLVRAAGLLFALAVAACAGGELPTGHPSFYRSLAQPNAALDADAAAAMLSGYRRNSGLPPVTIDPALMQLAEQQARAMGAQDRLSHDAGGAFTERMRKSGYPARRAAENIGAGYHTLADAFSGWRGSPPHRTNMLIAGATRMGIATVYAQNSKYKVYWALILAEPDEDEPRS